jgi:hypothetical protein
VSAPGASPRDSRSIVCIKEAPNHVCQVRRGPASASSAPHDSAEPCRLPSQGHVETVGDRASRKGTAIGRRHHPWALALAGIGALAMAPSVLTPNGAHRARTVPPALGTSPQRRSARPTSALGEAGPLSQTATCKRSPLRRPHAKRRPLPPSTGSVQKPPQATGVTGGGS